MIASMIQVCKYTSMITTEMININIFGEMERYFHKTYVIFGGHKYLIFTTTKKTQKKLNTNLLNYFWTTILRNNNINIYRNKFCNFFPKISIFFSFLSKQFIYLVSSSFLDQLFHKDESAVNLLSNDI